MKNTKDQDTALNNMLEWETNDVWRHTLNGAGGTGKTTIAKQFIDKLSIPRNKIAVTAPTHKAKKVIADATNFKAQTIQKLLGLRPNVGMDNFNPTKPVFLPMGEETIKHYKIIILDESSMINSKAFDLIKEKAEQYNIKILFMGDAFQLPPIGENISKVFMGGASNISTLTTIVRQEATNPMIDVLTLLRDDIKYSSAKAIDKLVETKENVYGQTGYRCLSNSKDLDTNFGKELLKMFLSTEYEFNKNYIKFITYTNDDVVLWSEALRHQILKEKAKNLINVGEHLIGYKTLINKHTNSIIVENSEDYIVSNITKETSKFGFKGFKTEIKNSDGYTKVIFIVDTNDEENENKFVNKILSLIKAAKADRRAWKQYYNFIEDHLSFKSYKYPNSKRDLHNKDLYYGYGITVHKSQGSTYDNVAINLKNLYLQQKVTERNKLIYVAGSRARNMNLIMI